MQHAEIISIALFHHEFTIEAAYLGSFAASARRGHETRIDRRMVGVRGLRPTPCQRW
jgi:hypothetical protein